ncbi:MAG: META domain-containing protein [Bacteroides sp.]|nr:META domain-containing protein [Bacteroides sp.]
MKKVFVSICMAAVLVGLSSCASTKNAATLSSIGGEWNIIEINGSAVVPAPGQEFPFIGFDTKTGKVYGNSGCNRLMGTFDVNAKPGTIDLGALGSTRMMCPDMTLERNVLSTLGQVKKYKKLGKGDMALCGSSNRPIIVLQKKEVSVKLSDLNGKWMISEAGGEAIPDGMEKQPFVEFNIPEMRLHGNAGCNIINGAIQTDGTNPTSISFPQLISTMTTCPDMAVEGRVTKALNEAQSFGKLAGGGIGLYNADNTLVMVLVKN